MRLDRREIRDLLVAWLALGLAFAFFFERVRPNTIVPFLLSPAFVSAMVVSLLTVGVGFLLHELAHKVVAIHFDQWARFQADYGMLLVAIAGGLAGIVFAAPGAVYHRGQLTNRQHGLIALAGPVTNLALAALFVPVSLFAPLLGSRGVTINLLLAAFNLLPIGALDGATVRDWNTAVYVLAFVPSLLLAIWAIFGF
ncbi:zinc metalloprotease [Halodesulfurarchaeum formicicum]|uniref:Metallopeptidase n=1 Tax=Halodesulfurarchaeum formicicum TaxID=1873524 RepID=A0A1J1AAZ9_9EURY|nr:metalloprotease [Halodesulfurarchaeum formicicum]APE95316.1 metallopeptidase [Halodesulfurarchaeum formicicum]